jgi:hypothetical protein
MKPMNAHVAFASQPHVYFINALSQVGLIQSDMTPEARRVAYLDDVTYVTNSELGFDYLRDNLAGVSKAAVKLRMGCMKKGSSTCRVCGLAFLVYILGLTAPTA